MLKRLNYILDALVTHAWDIWSQWIRVCMERGPQSDALIRKRDTDASKLKCDYNAVLDYIRNSKNNVTNEYHYMVCSGKRDGNSTYGAGPGYTTSDTSKNCTFSCTDTSPQYGRGNCGALSVVKNNPTLYRVTLLFICITGRLLCA